MSLHPEIQVLLAAFARRRSRLLLFRGALAGGSAFILGTILAVLIDAPLVLDDAPRVVLAGAVYAAFPAAFWWFGLRRMGGRSQAGLAGMLEAAEPRLRGTFLAAVELAPDAQHSDSTRFRESLQEQTAQRVKGMEVAPLLPLRLVRRQFAALAFAVLALACGFLFHGFRFGWQCARALLPLANFERLSDVAITILQPSPLEGIVPADEPLPVEVSVAGPGGVEPVLLARQGDGSRLRLPMRASGPGRYQASLPVEQGPLVYQVRAGYSLTRRFQLEPRPRPRIAVYARTYHYPEYAGLPERTVTSSDGAVSALEGTRVELTLTPDQAVAAGSLALTLGQLTREVPLETVTGQPGLLRAAFELTEGGAYTVRMVASETGLRSAAGPQQTIQLELDAPPNVSLDEPVADLVVPLGEKVSLAGVAEDDFGLAAVELEVRRNEAGWQRKPLAAAAGRRSQIGTAFDPVAYQARPGDVLGIRFSATDARGQRGESRTVRIAVAPPGTVALPDRALAAQRVLFKQVKDLAGESAAAVAALEKLKAQSERGTSEEVKAGEVLVRAEQALAKALQEAESARGAVEEAQEQGVSPGEGAALELEARVLGAAHQGELQAAKQTLERLLPLAANKAATTEAVRLALEAAAAGSALARAVEESVRTRLDVLEAAALAPAARALSNEVAEVSRELAAASAGSQQVPDPNGTADSAGALRRQQVNQTASNQVQGQLQKLVERSPSSAGVLRPALEELRKNQLAAEKASAPAAASVGEVRPEKTAAAGEALSRSLERTAKALDVANPALQAAAERAQTALKRADRTGGEMVERSAREITALAHKQNLPAEFKDTAAGIRVEAAADALRAAAEVESTALDSSPKLARALVQTASALDSAPAGTVSAAALGTQAAEVARLLKPVEGGAALESGRRKAEALEKQLNRQSGPPSPGQMAERKQLREELQNLPRQVREARLPEVSANAARVAGEALGGNSTAGLAKAAQALREGAEAAATAVDKALAELLAKAPALTAQMERLAAGAANASAATGALAEKQAGGMENQAAQHEVAGALRKESEFERQLDRLRQALRAEANAQDARSAAGREAARDADGAAARLKDVGNRAESALQQAAARPSERKPLLEKAAAFQKQGAEQLRSLADNFRKLESADPAERAAARQALRAGDRETGASAKLDARQERVAELAKLEELARESPSKALARSEAAAERDTPTNGGNPGGGNQPASESPGKVGAVSGEATGGEPSTGQGAKPQNMAGGTPEAAAGAQLSKTAKAEVAQARAALMEGGEGSAERAAQSFANALDAQTAADRSERLQEGAAQGGGGNFGGDLSGMADAGAKGLPGEKQGGGGEWGSLPKKLAADMLEGKREAAPSEYRDSVDAYFRAVAERARAGSVRK